MFCEIVPENRNGSCNTTPNLRRSLRRSCSRTSYAIDQHRSALHIVEPHHQRCNRGLARARVADDGSGCVGLDREAHAAQDPFNVAASTQFILCQSLHTFALLRRQSLVGEPDIAKLDAPAAVALHRMRAALDLCLACPAV